jgi:hypothetical protein
MLMGLALGTVPSNFTVPLRVAPLVTDGAALTACLLLTQTIKINAVIEMRPLVFIIVYSSGKELLLLWDSGLGFAPVEARLRKANYGVVMLR